MALTDFAIKRALSDGGGLQLWITPEPRWYLRRTNDHTNKTAGCQGTPPDALGRKTAKNLAISEEFRTFEDNFGGSYGAARGIRTPTPSLRIRGIAYPSISGLTSVVHIILIQQNHSFLSLSRRVC
jgi:hypothetical protein